METGGVTERQGEQMKTRGETEIQREEEMKTRGVSKIKRKEEMET